MIAIVLMAAFSSLLRNYSINRIARQLYDAAYVRKDELLFEKLISSLQARMCMSEKSRLIMSLNFYTFIDQEEKVIKLCEKMDGKRMNAEEFRTFYGKVIGYLCDKENEYALKLLNGMEDRYRNSKEISELLLLFDCQMACDIYIRKNTDRIKDLEELLKTDIPGQQKAVYRYRLAKLYYYQNNKEKAAEQLKTAKEETDDIASINKIERILNGEWELL